MKTPWVQTVRRETGLIENVCVHGIGHPAYASADFMDKAHKQPAGTHGIHGCCGCCRTDEWKIADARTGCGKANDIILRMMEHDKKHKRRKEQKTCLTTTIQRLRIRPQPRASRANRAVLGSRASTCA